MDRGAARSRKRAQKSDKPEASSAPAHTTHTKGSKGIRPPVEAGPSGERQVKARDDGRNGDTSGSRSQRDLQGHTQAARSRPLGSDNLPTKRHKPRNEEKEEQSRDPTLYRPKAIRDSTALVYSSTPFATPPNLQNVTRLDLEGSGVTDVSWIKGSGVTWLSLKGCTIESGWDAVGSLDGLTVLNISNCSLESLPQPLAQLGSLKALVAMNNPWTALDEEVVSYWKQLNSLIVSHSPHLSKLPAALSSLFHLSKLTFSHCPSLTTDGVPDLSSLPLLRDIKMNNLPLLDRLPKTLPTWGRGSMASIEDSRPSHKLATSGDQSRHGAGLQSLDIGNCALDYDSISSIFLTFTSSASFPNLRSLTLHGNPLSNSHPDYVQALTGSPNLPRLQVVDNKRVKEKVKRESKEEIKARERMERKMKPSGSNEASGGTMRKWGKELAPESSSKELANQISGPLIKKEGDAGKTHGAKRKRIGMKEQIHSKSDGKQEHGASKDRASTSDSASHVPKKAKVDSRSVAAGTLDMRQSKADATRPSAVDRPTADPSTRPTGKPNAKPSKSQTSVVGVIEVTRTGDARKLAGKQHKRKGDKAGLPNETGAQAGLDLRELFGKSDDAGLGVGSW